MQSNMMTHWFQIVFTPWSEIYQFSLTGQEKPDNILLAQVSHKIETVDLYQNVWIWTHVF